MNETVPIGSRIDVLVAGAGPTGLTLASDLRRWGLTVRVVDRSSGPQPGSRGFGVKPRTLEVFDDLEVADDVLAASRIASRTRIHLGHELLSDLEIGQDEPSPARRFPNSVALPQWRTEEVLRAGLRARGVEVEFGTTLVGFDADPDGVTAQLQSATGTERVRAAYLAGCDGGRSTVRRLLGVSFDGTTSEEFRVLLADVELQGLTERDATHIWLGPGSNAFVLRPSGDGRWQAVASLARDASGRFPSESPELLQELAGARTGMPGLRLGEPSWMSVWRYSLRMVDRYRVGRVFLAGDAAHVHSPFGAFGMNTGVQDAYNLGWKLGLVLTGRAGVALLDTYQAERLPVGKAVLAESDRNLTSATSPPRLLGPLVRLLVKPYLTRLQRRGRHDHPDYRNGPLSRQIGSRRRRVRAGDSAPDGLVRCGADAEPVRLSTLLRGTHFTVLAFGAQHADLVDAVSGPVVRAYAVGTDGVPGPGRIVDVDATLRRAYRARAGTVVVIRPDGYIGLFADDGDAASVREYLGHCLGTSHAPSVSCEV